jgi:hypothetical protein
VRLPPSWLRRKVVARSRVAIAGAHDHIRTDSFRASCPIRGWPAPRIVPNVVLFTALEGLLRLTQLEWDALTQRDAVENARIHIHQIGTAQQSLAHVAEAA